MEVGTLEVAPQVLGVGEVDVAPAQAQGLAHPQAAVVEHGQEKAIAVAPRRREHADELDVGDHLRGLELQRHRELVLGCQAFLGHRPLPPGLRRQEAVVGDR